MRFLIHCLRRLRDGRLYSLISIAGLTIGTACALCILLYTIHETAFDRFLDDHDRIYRLIRETRDEKNHDFFHTHPGGLAAAVEESIPEVEEAVRIWAGGGHSQVIVGDRKTRIFGTMVGSEFLDVFSFELLRGDRTTALAKRHQIVLTEETARQFFGDEDPMGKRVKVNNVDIGGDFIVTGIMKQPPTHTSIYFRFLTTYRGWMDEVWDGWSDGTYRYQTRIYVRLAPGADPAHVERGITTLASSHLYRQGTTTFHLQPITESHLFSTADYGLAAWGSIEQLRRIAAMGLFVLAIACLNFVNIATARSLTRTTEVGIRKVVGATRQDLFRLFLGESFVSALIALGVGVLLCAWMLPTFNAFVDRPLDMGLFTSPYGVVCVLGLAAAISLAVGVPHGLVLSSLHPVALLKGSAGGRTRSWMRQILVGVQFALSILLVLITFAMRDQMDFLRNRNLGYRTDGIVTLPLYVVDWQTGGKPVEEHLSWDSEKVEQAFLEHPNVLAAAGYRYSMGMQSRRKGGPLRRTLRGPDGREIQMPMQEVDDDFLETFGIRLLAGRNFDPNREADFGSTILLNQAAVEAFGLEDPIGVQLDQMLVDAPVSFTTIGVVEDFHLLSLHAPIQPFAIYMNRGRFRTLALRISTEDVPETIAFLEETWKRFLPDQTFKFQFLDDWLQIAYEEENKLAQTFGAAAVAALIIACIGLYGLTAFSVDRKMKEIGVRKVLGASVGTIVTVIARDLSRPVILANGVAWPVGYWAVRSWLDGFAYRMDLTVMPFLLAGLVGLAIALITIVMHAWRGAQADPVETLRYE